MASTFPPTVMRAWQYTSTKGGLDKNLKLNPSTSVPKLKPNQNLIQVIAAAVNPIDYKPAELPIIGRLLVPNPATPGLDFAGRVVIAAAGSPWIPGQLVFGVSGTSPLAGGALAEFTLAESTKIVALPEGVDPVDAATVGVAGITAYQSIVPRVKEGDKIFINGGSGGTGVFGIQFAKAVGCHVTTTCSTANVELCKSLGADEVVDYKKGSVFQALKASGTKFDHAVDNVGGDKELIWGCGDILKPGGAYVLVGGSPTVGNIFDMLKRKIIPGFLGGVRGKVEGFWPATKSEDVAQIGEWMKEGKVKSVIDSKIPFEDAPKSIEKLKTGRAKGKVVVDVASEKYKSWVPL